MRSEFYPAKVVRVLLASVLVLIFFRSSSQQVARSTTFGGHTIPFLEYKPTDYDPDIQYPLIIFLHGQGERGPSNGSQLNAVKGLAIPHYIDQGATMTFTHNGQPQTFLVLSPQLSDLYDAWQNVYVDAMFDWISNASNNMNVDPNRIYLTGISLGGGGVWRYTNASLANAQKFAAVAPVCGTCHWTSGLCDLGQANTAVWAFHAQDDGVVGVGCTNGAIDYMNACDPEPLIEPKKTIYSDGNHWIWDRAYDMGHTWQSPLNLFEWFLSYSRNTTVNACDTNTAPIAEAGNNTFIYGTTHTLSAWGSGDPGGGPITYQWTQESGPNQATIGGDIYATAQLSNLIPGFYAFILVVTDSCDESTADTTILEVRDIDCDTNTAPIAQAGNSLTIYDDEYTLSSWGSGDPGGGPITFNWTQVSGPNNATISGPMYATAQVSSLIHGTYVFQLDVVDVCEDTTTDQITVEVNLSQRRRDPAAIQQNEPANSFRAYPNPAGDRLYISFNSSLKNKIRISVTDLNGRVIKTTEMMPALLSRGIDVSGLKTGIYILHIESDGKKYTQKFFRK